jgi:hypothetical protein
MMWSARQQEGLTFGVRGSKPNGICDRWEISWLRKIEVLYGVVVKISSTP